jgi:nucleoid-associated protein YgaU
MSRYASKKVMRNNTTQYRKMLKERGLKHVDQFGTPMLRHPTAGEISSLDVLGHIWKQGDRYFKLAHKHYGNAEFWWVIAWYNKRPTESHVKIGDTIAIPTPLEKVLNYMKV